MTIHQTELNFAKASRDEGIQRAINNANRKSEGWSEEVYEYFKLFLRGQVHHFQSEDFREFVKDLVPEPPSKRAFGWIMVRARKEGLIKRVGTEPVNNATAHRCFATVWAKV